MLQHNKIVRFAAETCRIHRLGGLRKSAGDFFWHLEDENDWSHGMSNVIKTFFFNV